MTTVMPEGEAIRIAVKWISDNLRDDPSKSIQKLINEAVMRFDLSPKDAEDLKGYLSKVKTGAPQ
jgi:hypothetical protein